MKVFKAYKFPLDSSWQALQASSRASSEALDQRLGNRGIALGTLAAPSSMKKEGPITYSDYVLGKIWPQALGKFHEEGFSPSFDVGITALCSLPYGVECPF
jgi:hypothetical protein